MTLERAHDIVLDVSYFGTMMVHEGLADGMVSGAAHSTAHTIRPAFEIIKTAPGRPIVSSVFFMCLADRVLVYGDCAVIPDPTVEQLADIAVSSAATAAPVRRRAAGRDAVVLHRHVRHGRRRRQGPGGDGAGAIACGPTSGRGPDPVRRRRRRRRSADQAAGVEVAGHATVFIFPDLNTGNNTYKAVQRSAGAVAIGPVLQGLHKPVNDLSRAHWSATSSTRSPSPRSRPRRSRRRRRRQRSPRQTARS